MITVMWHQLYIWREIFKWAGLTTEAACSVGAAAVLLWLSRLFVNEAPLKKIQVDVLTNTVNVLAFIYIISSLTV